MAQELTRTARIDASPEDIRAWLDDWSNIRAWMGPTLVSIDMLSDHDPDEPIRAGMRFRETRRVGKVTAKARVEVRRHEIVDGALIHQAVIDDGCNRMVSDYLYEPGADGGTRASWTMRNEPDKWWTRALKPVLGTMMIKMCEKHEGDHLDRLKALIESPRPATETEPSSEPRSEIA